MNQHISNYKKTRNIPRIAFQSWALQASWFSQPKIFFSILVDLQAFPVSGHFLDSNESVLRWKKISKKIFFFLYSLCLTKLSLFFLLSFLPKMSSQVCLTKMTIFQRLVIWREKTLMGSLDSYEKLVWLRSFNWARKGTQWIHLVKLQ